MIKKVIIASTFILASLSAFASNAQAAEQNIEKGKQYIELPKYASPEKEVVEFFSFNCPSCYKVENEYKLGDKIKENLPKNVVFKRYSLSGFGPLASELGEAWAIANVLNITNEVSQKLYDGIQKDRTIKTADDIKAVFESLGVSSEKFESMKSNFLVKTFMAQQEDAQKELQPTSIPTYYVNGKYFINPKGLDNSSNDAVIKDYLRVTSYLTQLN